MNRIGLEHVKLVGESGAVGGKMKETKTLKLKNSKVYIQSNTS